MRKYTQKQLREFVRLGIARDITHISLEEAYQLHTSQEGYSSGVNGINGALFRNVDTGDLMVVTARSTILFVLA